VTKIGVAGHGYGAYTALLLAGARTFPGGAQYGDPRVKAAIAISPPGLSEARGLTRESWSSVDVPVLFLTGSQDQGVVESETPEWRREAFALLPAGEKWLVVIEGARHGTFAGRFDDLMEQAARQRGRDNPPNPDVQRTVPRGQTPSRAETVAYQQQSVINLTRGLGLAFWDTYLRANAEGREALETAGGRMNVIVEKR
jgi:predicted dienelactone hydrolase